IYDSSLEHIQQAKEACYRNNPRVAQVDFLVLELPGVRMRDEDRAQPRLDCGINIRAGTVANHKAVRRIEPGRYDQRPVGGDVFFGRDFYRAEMAGESRTLQLADLLVALSLGEEQQAMARGELGKRRGD